MKSPSSALPSYSSAAQRRAMPRGAMPFALGCDAVPCCGVFFFNIQYQVSSEKYQVPGMIDYNKHFCFLHLVVLSRSCSFSQITPVLPIRRRHRQQAHITAQRAISSAQTSSCWHYQIASCTKSWATHFFLFRPNSHLVFFFFYPPADGEK